MEDSKLREDASRIIIRNFESKIIIAQKLNPKCFAFIPAASFVYTDPYINVARVSEWHLGRLSLFAKLF